MTNPLPTPTPPPSPTPPATSRSTPTQRRIQGYSLLLALTMLALAVTCGQIGVRAWQQTGPASAWLSLLGALLFGLGAPVLLFFSLRSIRASLAGALKRRKGRASTTQADPAPPDTHLAP